MCVYARTRAHACVHACTVTYFVLVLQKEQELLEKQFNSINNTLLMTEDILNVPHQINLELTEAIKVNKL